MEPTVSVIIPTYKRPFETLQNAIQSVLNQTTSNLEIIVVDDSPDSFDMRNDIKEKVEGMGDSRITLIQHESNKGACVARNTGIKHSSGQFISFLDDDDEWLPEKVSLQLEKFTEKEIGLVYCDSITTVIKNGKVVKEKIRSFHEEDWVFNQLILRNFIGSTSFVMIRREVFDKVGLFNESLKSAQDAELWLRISKQYKIKHVQLPLVRYFAHDQERITTNVDNKIQGLEMLNEINEDYLIKNKKIFSTRKLILVPFYKKKYGKKTAFIKWLEAVKLYPFKLENINYLRKLL